MHRSARAGWRVRNAVLTALLCTLALTVNAWSADPGSQHRFNIAPQSLDTALLAFSDQANVQVVMDGGKSSNVKSPGVSGQLRAVDALKALLHNTGLDFRQVDASTVAILPPGAAVPAAPQDVPATPSAEGRARVQPSLRRDAGEQLAPTRARILGTAHSADAQHNAGEPLEQVIVTGSLLRGFAPVTGNHVSLSSVDIAAAGASSTNQLLAKIPQISSAFNQVPTLQSTNPGLSIIYPNIRNLPAGGTTTLVLLDGHRVGASGGFAAVDPDVIPTVVIQRVDVMADGGSSIYGSDAVGGVINFITRKRVDGFAGNSHYGFGADYRTVDANFLAGTDWNTGSGYLSYTYATSSELLGRQRDYYRQVTANGGFCAPGTASINRGGVSTTYALPDRIANAVSSCDNTDELTVFPSFKRHSVFGSLTQSLADSVEAGITAFYTQRRAISHIDLNSPAESGAQTGTITAANPYYVPIAPDIGSQTVNFSYAGIIDNERSNELTQSSMTPTLTADLGDDWQLRALTTFGHSRMVFSDLQIDSLAQTTALAATTFDTALNPYDVALTNPTVLQHIVLRGSSQQAQTFKNARAIVDGSPGSLPGGELRLAVGAEYGHEEMSSRLSGTFNGNAHAGRSVKSAFGEMAIPIFGSGNALTGIENLRLSASARYDDYSDIGDSVAPKVGITYSPVNWVMIRANWGKSFSAPGLNDTTAAADNRAVLLPVSPGLFVDPGDNAETALQRPMAILAGGNNNLKPQKADTWSIGADIETAVWPQLKLSLTYYSLEMWNQITLVPIFTAAQAYRPVYSQWIVKNPTLAQARQMIGNLPLVNSSSIDAWYNNPNGTPYAILDARRQNLGTVKQDGIDFNASYAWHTRFGAMNANVGGTYTLNRKIAAVAGDVFADNLQSPGASRFSCIASLGLQAGNLAASSSLSHTAGYDIHPGVNAQTHVDAFNTVDLYFAYQLATATGLMKDLLLTTQIGNVFDKDPPLYNQDPGFANGSTVGRLIQIGFSKQF